jgi:hypothetical protein
MIPPEVQHKSAERMNATSLLLFLPNQHIDLVKLYSTKAIQLPIDVVVVLFGYGPKLLAAGVVGGG